MIRNVASRVESEPAAKSDYLTISRGTVLDVESIELWPLAVLVIIVTFAIVTIPANIPRTQDTSALFEKLPSIRPIIRQNYQSIQKHPSNIAKNRNKSFHFYIYVHNIFYIFPISQFENNNNLGKFIIND